MPKNGKGNNIHTNKRPARTWTTQKIAKGGRENDGKTTENKGKTTSAISFWDRIRNDSKIVLKHCKDTVHVSSFFLNA